MVKKTEKALSLGQRAKAKAQRAARAARELERGVSTRAGSKTSQGVERIPETSTRNLGRGFGLRQTGEGKGSRMATKAQRDAVVKSGRKRVAGGAAASLLAGQSLFGDDKGKRTKPGGGVLDPNKAEKKESPKKYNVGVSKGGVPFKEAFKHHRGKGAKTFTWNGKKYTTELDTEKAKRTAAKKPDSKKSAKRGLIFGKDAKVRPFGGAIARVLLGKDEKFGGDRGAIDFLPGKSRKKKEEKPVKKMGGGMMKSKMASKGGARGGRKPTGMKAGGSLEMTMVGGRKVPAFAADGKGSNDLAKKAMGGMMKSKMASKGGAKGGRKPGGMKAGGVMKSKGMAKGGAMKKKGYAMGGMTKKGMAKGGAMTKKGLAKGGATTKKKAVSRKPRGVGAALRGYGRALK
tara:strand:+ start:2034 stop:3239 length:1206 start_codon:yes stop_codon:yes gene_type:complete